MPRNETYDINRLTKRFRDRSLPKAEWTHRAHFAVALGLLADAEVDAFAEMPQMIRAYNEATGVANTDTEGYHETITLASLRVASAFLRNASSETPLEDTLETLMSSRYGRSNWLLEHWSRERLFSVEARRTWEAPDLAELPF
ncbi:MAG: hypothetical protein AAFQ24_00875 [Pseudomonadota bacterium]